MPPVILVVDDVAALAEQYAYDLNRLGGFTTMTAGGGRDALEMLEREAVADAVLDVLSLPRHVHMPQISLHTFE